MAGANGPAAAGGTAPAGAGGGVREAEAALEKALSDQLGALAVNGVNADANAADGVEGAAPTPPEAAADADEDDTARKLFIGGLSWSSTPEALRAYFAQFGEVADCQVMRDPHTGKSRGFGFVTFASREVSERVVTNPDGVVHSLDGRTIDPKRAVPRSSLPRGGHPGHQHEPRDAVRRKIFVGGLGLDCTVQNVTECFSQFGRVSEVILMTDRESKRPRGFGFVTFAAEATAAELVSARFVECNGKQVECKLAQPKGSSDGRPPRDARGGGGGVSGGPLLIDGAVAEGHRAAYVISYSGPPPPAYAGGAAYYDGYSTPPLHHPHHQHHHAQHHFAAVPAHQFAGVAGGGPVGAVYAAAPGVAPAGVAPGTPLTVDAGSPVTYGAAPSGYSYQPVYHHHIPLQQPPVAEGRPRVGGDAAGGRAPGGVPIYQPVYHHHNPQQAAGYSYGAPVAVAAAAPSLLSSVVVGADGNVVPHNGDGVAADGYAPQMTHQDP